MRYYSELHVKVSSQTASSNVAERNRGMFGFTKSLVKRRLKEINHVYVHVNILFIIGRISEVVYEDANVDRLTSDVESDTHDSD